MRRNSEKLDLIDNVKESLGLALCDTIKFLYGFLFGTLMWNIMAKPYVRYYDFELGSYWPEFLFSLVVAFLFMASMKLRCIMVLFLPSMIGNATQNYIVMLLIVTLLSNPISNIGYNTVESVRVIGCSLAMTFESLRERAKLILNPVVEILSDESRKDIEPIMRDLLDVQHVINDLRQGAQLSRASRQQALNTNNINKNKARLTSSSGVTSTKPPDLEVTRTATASPAGYLTTAFEKPVDGNNSANSDATITSDTNNKAAAANREYNNNLLKGETARRIIERTRIELDPGNFGLKASVDLNEIRQLIALNRQFASARFNLTETLYQSCLDIFRDAKLNCQIVMDEMQASCKRTIGPFLATIWCSPIFFTFSSTCPWLMDQLVDDKSLCQQLRNASTTQVDFGSKQMSLDDLYAELSSQVESLNDEILPDESADDGGKQQLSRRLELSITFNEKTRAIFRSAGELIKFIQDKYKMRKLLLNLILLVYDLYTSYTFLVIIAQARAYLQNYLNQIRFDNCYITGKFVQLDKQAAGRRDKHRRASSEANEPAVAVAPSRQASVLPLTREESRKYIATFTCRRRTAEERHLQRGSCWLIVLFLLFTFSLLFLDDIFHSILDSVNQHALVHFNEIGQHKLNITVRGEGSMARLVGRLSARLNSLYELNRSTSTRDCLPRARRSSLGFYLDFLLYVTLYFLIDQISIYAMRLRRLTCAFFYPQNEHQRIVFLREFILAQRRRARALADTPTLEGLAASADDDDDDDDDVEVADDGLTVRDALNYIGTCVRQSIKRCGQRGETGRN